MKTQLPPLYFNGRLRNVKLGCASCGRSWHPKGCNEANQWKLPKDYATCPHCGQQHAPIESSQIAERFTLNTSKTFARRFHEAAQALGERLGLRPAQARSELLRQAMAKLAAVP